MSRAEISRVFSHLYREGLRIVFVQGGEPFLRKDLPDILDDLSSIGFTISLITNGTKLTSGLLARLARHPISISISLDTLDRQRYRTIRGADQLPLVLKGIELLDEYPHSKYLTCIVSEINRDDVLDVMRFARNHGMIPVLGAYHWDVSRYGKIDLTLQYQKVTATAVFQEVLESNIVPNGYFRNYLQDNIRWLNDQRLPSCDAGRYSIAIDASGNVRPCLALPHTGNLLSSTLPDLLDNLDYSAIRQCSNRSSCNMLCSRVIGSNLRHPLSALRTAKIRPQTQLKLKYAH
jgi:MoaA/NifB/PqqE/SkfB family radical SAM enzyme